MRTEPCLSALVENSGNELRSILHALGVNRKTWNDWLWGISEPSKEQRDMLARWLNCSVVVIDVAVARNRASWERYQHRLATDNTLKGEENSTRFVIIETIVQVVVSAVTAVIATLMLSGKI